MIKDIAKLSWALFLVAMGVVAIPFQRGWRWFRHKCLVCGRNIHPNCIRPQALAYHYRYCSIECAAYDGALRNPSKSCILIGTVKEPKRHHEDHYDTD